MDCGWEQGKEGLEMDAIHVGAGLYVREDRGL